MLIGVDKDDVVFEFKRPFLEYYNRRYETSLKFEDITLDDPAAFFGISRYRVLREYLSFRKETRNFLDLKPTEGAVDALALLAEQGHCFVLVTAMPRMLEGETPALLHRYFNGLFERTCCIPFHKLWFSGRNYKHPLYEAAHVDVVIEDSLRVAQQCVAAGLRTFLLNYPWNQFEVRGVERVASWSEIPRLL